MRKYVFHIFYSIHVSNFKKFKILIHVENEKFYCTLSLIETIKWCVTRRSRVFHTLSILETVEKMFENDKNSSPPCMIRRICCCFAASYKSNLARKSWRFSSGCFVFILLKLSLIYISCFAEDMSSSINSDSKTAAKMSLTFLSHCFLLPTFALSVYSFLLSNKFWI